jgi:hypothetical protein
MFIYNGGTAVAKGIYWSPMDGGRIDMRYSGILPGEKGRGYLRMSPVILLFIAPFLGVTFIFFLPLFGMGVLIGLCLLSAGGALSALAATAIRICCGKGTKRISGGKRIFTGGYRPLGASFTGTVKSKAKGSRVK